MTKQIPVVFLQPPFGPRSTIEEMVESLEPWQRAKNRRRALAEQSRKRMQEEMDKENLNYPNFNHYKEHDND